MAKASRFAGAVAERCDSVGGFVEKTVDRAGAEEFGWLNRTLSGVGDRAALAPSTSFGDSVAPLPSNASGGMNDVDPEECECR